MKRVLVVNALPLEAGGFVERNLSSTIETLQNRDAHVVFCTTRERARLRAAVDACDVILVGDLRPGADLLTAEFLANVPKPLVLYLTAFPFCEPGHHHCEPCPLREKCAETERARTYRSLAEAAAAIVYVSPLHRRESVMFIGDHPDRTHTLVPPDWGEPAHSLVERVGAWTDDPHELTAVEAWSRKHGNVTLLSSRLESTDAPHRVSRLAAQGPNTARRMAAFRTVLALPVSPQPFIAHAALAAADPRRVAIANEAAGYTSFESDAHVLYRARVADGQKLVDLVLTAEGSAPRRYAPDTSFLLWCHDLGLGDSISLLPIANGLARLGPTRWVLPQKHRELLQWSFDGTEDHETFNLDDGDASLTLEVTIRLNQFHDHEIVDRRWVQLALERAPSPLNALHENLMTFANRGGLRMLEERPRLTLPANLGEPLVFVDKTRLVVTVHPGAGFRQKCWPANRFGEVCTQLRKAGAQVVLIGGIREDDILDEVCRHTDEGVQVVRAPKLVDAAALMRTATIHLGNDSGLSHVAHAVGATTVIVFGPSDPRIWGPANPNSAVVSPPHGQPRQMEHVEVSDVLRQLARTIRRVALEPPTQTALLAGTDAKWVDSTLQTPFASVSVSSESFRRRLRDLHSQSQGQSFSSLVKEFDEETVELALACGLVVPTWAASSPMLDWLQAMVRS